MLKKIPLPISGLMLALAALGNLVQSYSEIARYVFGIISGILFIVLTIKVVLGFNLFKEEMKNPIIASVMPTYSMTGMLLAGYLKPFIGNAANIFWYLMVLVHIIFIIYFTIKFVFNFKLENMYPSWVIVYVGIVVASVTGKAFNQEIGKYAFYFGLVSYFVLLILNIARLTKIELKEPAKPIFAILAAPGSLCLAGYMNIIDNKNMIFTLFLLILSQLIYIKVLFKMFSLLKLKFYPSYSSFTFPLVITGLAFKLTVGYLGMNGIKYSILNYLVTIEVIIATVMVLYVLFRYIKFLIAINN